MDKQVDLYKTILYKYINFIKNKINNKNINININTFIYDSNKPLKEGIIPHSVIHLIFGDYFNQPLEEGNIPYGVKNLTFERGFNQPLEEGVIPHSVTHLTFEGMFNQPLEEDVIPNSVIHLTFGWRFDRPLDNIIFKNIISLVLHKDYLYKNSLNNNDKLIFYYENNYYIIIYDNIKISLNDMIEINKYIDNNLTEDKLIGKVIYKELIEKVLRPERLMQISKIYNVNFQDLVNNY